MKRILAVVMGLFLFMMAVASAEGQDVTSMTDQEKINLATELLSKIDDESINAIIAERIKNLDSDTLSKLADIISAEVDSREDLAPFTTMQKGSKGGDVTAAQQRLIDLGYLSGIADGAFGGMTEEAVKLFQQQADLEQTGVIDKVTWSRLKASDAPIAKVYQSLDYKSISRDPDNYKGRYYKFSGKVVQVLESSNSSGTTTVNLRVATKGNYDDVVYIVYERSANESRILEDDRVTVYAISGGLYSYTSVLGSTITLPYFEADSVTVN